jgi:putative DNA primase/helicase
MMSAETIVAALRARKVGSGWMAPCPAHADRTPSLSIHVAQGEVLVHCHAGCNQDRVIAALRERGLWAENGPRSPLEKVCRAPLERESDQDNAKRSEVALAIWQLSKASPENLVEIYLASRGIFLPVPDALRFHAGLKHPSGGIWPVMVGLVTRGTNGKPLGVHRTFLARDGKGKAPIEPAKMMLGPCRGGAVRLAEVAGVLMIGEGIETCLAAMQATGHPAWAALSTSGMRGLELPDGVRNVVVLADGDEAGETAARDCAHRWKREGRHVRIARTLWGMDFNDMLKGRAARIKEGAQ